IQEHVEAVLKDVGPAKVRVVVDCGCGATCTITPFLLRQMGCDVTAMNAQADGHFPGRDPEPTEENLAGLAATVRATRADLGIAHDGDGDRMVAMDADGRFVGGDVLLALFARREVRRGLVVPVDASMVLSDLLPNATIWRTRVGDVYVAAELKRRGADFGGEPSGTWIFPKATLCPDGVYAAAKLVSIVAERPLSLLVKEIPRYPMFRGSIPYPPSERASIESRLDRALRNLGADVSVLDGWRLQFDDGWALVRFSGTEPKIRFLAESRDERRAKEIYSAVVSSAKGAAA
ncbi:MAG: phosphoglucosamine mutase, partial [Thermoplasmata archaeon]